MMALVLEGLVATMDAGADRALLPRGAVYVDDQGKIAAVQAAGEPVPAGFETARRVSTGGVIYPGLIDLHNHLAYNCLPLWAPPGREEPFTSRQQWPRLDAYTTDVRMPTLALTQVASKALLKYVETKAVVGGVTAIQGSAKMSRPYEGWLVRNVEYETFGTAVRTVFQSVRTLGTADFPTARDHMTGGSAFIYHLAEGTSPSLLSEYTDLKDNDCLLPRLVAIHATALGDPEYADWGPHGSSMVWSPLSNLWLYRHTSDVVAARRHGIRVCLGADWSPSGSKHLLGELKVADLWNQAANGLGQAFTDAELCEMVTANPADALGWSDRIGRIRQGLYADLLVLRHRVPDAHRNLIEATEHDVRLVLVGGRPVYGTPGMMRSSGADELEPINVGGRRRSISLVEAGVPDADMTWRQVVAALEAVRRDPAGAQQRVQVAAAATGEEPLRLIPDDPGGEPPVLLAAADLGEVRIRPLDPLAHDSGFFAALRSAPILGGLLDDLQGYYQR
jgi:5-methylthioadenosine/S-adenosylhomocysteine deaminase